MQRLWRSLWWIWLLSLLCWWCKDCEITKWQTKDWQSLWIYDLTWLGFIYGIWKILLVGFSKVYVNIDTLLELLVTITTLTHSSSIYGRLQIQYTTWGSSHDNDTMTTTPYLPLGDPRWSVMNNATNMLNHSVQKGQTIRNSTQLLCLNH